MNTTKLAKMGLNTCLAACAKHLLEIQRLGSMPSKGNSINLLIKHRALVRECAETGKRIIAGTI